MIAETLVPLFRTSRYRARQLKRWIRKHPRRSFAAGLFLAWLVASVLGATTAYADDNGDITLPWLPPTEIADSHGVSLTHYALLPLDRGDLLHISNQFIANLIDPLWAVNVAALGWVLWLFQWILTFEWVAWLATPVNAIAELIQSFVSQIGFIPFALALTAVVCGFAMLSGRYAKGAIEIGISVLCSVLAVGLLANPVAALTGDNGALPWAQSWGGNIAASVVSDPNDPQLPNGDPSASDAKKVISTSIVGELTDIFIRRTAQIVAFGHELTGDCDEVFTTQMTAASPIDTSSTSVRDAVGACDKEAGEYVTHPNFGQVFTTASIMGGSGVLLLLGLGFAMITLMAVLYGLFQALKLMFAVYAAVMPGVARTMLWRSLIGMYVGAISVGISVVLLAVYLVVLSSVLHAASDAGLNIYAQTLIIDLVVVALLIGLVIARHKAKKAGESLADRLARLGFGSPSQPKAHPLARSATRAAERYVVNKITNRPAAATKTPAATPAATALDAGEFTATPSRRMNTSADPSAPDTSSRSLSSKVTAGASTTAQLAVAAASGGTSAVALKATKIAGKTVIQRHLNVPSQPRSAFQQKVAGRASEVPRSEPFGRQIVIDRNGVGRIASRREPTHSGAYNVTSLKPARDVSSTPIRAALERASKLQESK